MNTSLEGETLRVAASGVEWTAANCESDFEQLNNIEDVNCAQSNLDSSDTLSATYTITLNSFPKIPHENNIFSHEGNPILSQITCDTSEVISGTNPTCVVTDVTNTNIKGMAKSVI